MKGRILKFLISFVAIIFVGFLIFYLCVAFRYKDGFSYDTKINGVFCTGKSVSDVNLELKKQYEGTEFQIISDVCESEIINLSDIDFEIDFTDSLLNIISAQNYLLWFENVFYDTTEKYLDPMITYDKEKLNSKLKELTVYQNFSPSRKQIVEIRYSNEKGYYIFEDTSLLLDYDLFYDLIYASLSEGSFRVEIPSECFSERELSDENKKVYSVWNSVKSFFDTKVIYDMGEEQVPIDSPVLSLFVSFDSRNNDFVRSEDGSLFIDRNKVDEYVDYLADQYDTFNSPRKFTTFSGEEKEIKNVYYGTLLNRVSEKKYLYEAITNNTKETHVPSYLREGYVRGKNDIGKDYIEIDLTNQVLYLILDNRIEMTTDIVSGRPSRGDATPEMVCSITLKKKNAILRGEGYVSPVSYWMPVYKGIGIHDATWQKAFGGDRYLKYGSHGCINVSLEDAKKIYDLVFVGMPVVVYK